MIPIETSLSLYPRVVAEEYNLRPLSLCHITAMETIGIDTGREIGGENAVLCAWILSMTYKEIHNVLFNPELAGKQMAVWSQKIKSIEKLKAYINEIFSVAFLPFVASKGGNSSSLMPTGYGWPLEMAELMCHSYGWSIEYVMDLPLSTVFGFAACARNRVGGAAGGPDYYERIVVRNIKAANKRE